MTESLEITPVAPVHGSIRPPGSKSITNRALICAALATGQSLLRGALDSEDTQVMIKSLQALGIVIQPSENNTKLIVHGCGGQIKPGPVDLFVANSGTTIRFLTAAVACGKGVYRLDGIERMRERPIADLLDALQRLGVNATSENQNGCPPVVVETNGLPGGMAEVRGDISSQYLSGLLMAAPAATAPVELRVTGELVSRPYIDITLAVMKSFGATVIQDGPSSFKTSGSAAYLACAYDIEPDASAASYFWGAAAVTGGSVRVEGLSATSLQGDTAFCEVLEQMGCSVKHDTNSITVAGGKLRGVDVDMNAISDTVQTLAAVALFAEGPTRVRGVAHNRHKETDRIGDLACELRKLGAEVEEHEDGLTITPGEHRAAEIETYNDHRMAMSLALTGLRLPGVIINNPSCTVKTYPHFFKDLAQLSGS